MSKILKALLYPFTELAGWLVMRDLRRWAREYLLLDDEYYFPPDPLRHGRREVIQGITHKGGKVALHRKGL